MPKGRSLSMLVGMLATMLLTACQTSAPRADFTPRSDRGTVIAGLRSDLGGAFEVSFKEVVPGFCSVDQFKPGQTASNLWGLWKQNERHFYMEDFRPGNYVLWSFRVQDGLSYPVYWLQTVAFTVRAGEVVYIGDFFMNKKVAIFEGYDTASVQTFLRGYPNVTTVPIERSGIMKREAGALSDCKGMGRISERQVVIRDDRAR